MSSRRRAAAAARGARLTSGVGQEMYLSLYSRRGVADKEGNGIHAEPGHLIVFRRAPRAARHIALSPTPGTFLPRPSLTDTSFGARLRHERERRRISLASIAANTKIATPLLEGLERGDISRWPGGIYRRSFMKAYAAAIGLDPVEATREFLEHFPDPAEVPPSPPTTPPVEPAAAVAAADAATASGRLRLTIEQGAPACRGGRLLTDARQRVGAAASDLGILTLIGLGFAAALGEFWMPLAVSMVFYYLGGILVLGNTPGVCLFAAIVDDVPAVGGGERSHPLVPDGQHPAAASSERY